MKRYLKRVVLVLWFSVTMLMLCAGVRAIGDYHIVGAALILGAILSIAGLATLPLGWEE